MALTDMEAQRAARIALNKARMAELGLTQVVEDIKKDVAAKRAASRKDRVQSKAQAAALRAAARAAPRRSARVEGIEAPNYNENSMLLALADRTTADTRDRRLMRENITEEIYGIDHLKALGGYKQEWELFVDGYDASGNRIYDKVNGQTCHQCRQKTLGKRTSCSGCKTLQGVFCGDCLFMRYGENVDEANANPNWLCPLCRDLCNCSFHRSKRGWAPTGTLYRRAAAEGYKSVAHYLVLNNLKPEAKPAALAMAPPELRKELEKEIKEEEKAAAAAAPSSQGPADGPVHPSTSTESEAQEEAGPSAVDAHLLEPEGDEVQGGAVAAKAAEPAPRRRGRSGSVAVKMLDAATTGRKRKATVEAVAVKAKPASPAVPQRRGLRSSVKA